MTEFSDGVDLHFKVGDVVKHLEHMTYYLDWIIIRVDANESVGWRDYMCICLGICSGNTGEILYQYSSDLTHSTSTITDEEKRLIGILFL